MDRSGCWRLPGYQQTEELLLDCRRTRMIGRVVASTSLWDRSIRLMRSPGEAENADGSWFNMVSELDFEVVPASCLTCSWHHPPDSDIQVSSVNCYCILLPFQVSLGLDLLGTKPDVLCIVAPPDFTFNSPDCLYQYSGTDLQGCRVSALELPDGSQRQVSNNCLSRWNSRRWSPYRLLWLTSSTVQ